MAKRSSTAWIGSAWPVGLALFIGAMLQTTGALAAGSPAVGTSEASEALMIAQVVILVLLGRLLGELMFRIGQPSIIGQIVAGILLGPTVLGNFWPGVEAFLFPASPEQNAMINGLSLLGIMFLLLLAGMETDLGLAYRLRRTAFGVSVAGIAVPFACGFAAGMLVPANLLPDPDKRLVAALFLGTALSISSLKIVATVVREMNFMRRNVGQLIIASAVIDDTAGWVIIALTLGIATTGTINLASLAMTVGGTIVFLALSFTVGRRLVFEIIRWTNDSLHSDLPVTTAIIGIMGVLALITIGLGVQAVLGAFVAGMLIGQSPILTRQIDEQLRGLTTALFMPVFFGLTGLHADLRVLANPETLALTAGLILIASIGKFGGAFVGGMLNGMTRAEALALGFGMNARGSTEVIVASIGLSVGVLDQRLFSVIVTMAIVTTLVMPPTLRWALKRLPVREEEQQRLARESFEEDSVVGQLERILLVVDRSAGSRLAALLAGHMAGLRNMPVTALNVGREAAANGEGAEAATGASKAEAQPTDKTEKAEKGDKAEKTDKPTTAESEVVAQVKASSEGAIAKARETDETREESIHVGTRVEPADLTKALASESEKGHDLMFVGVEPLMGEEGGFDPRIEAMLTAFKRAAVIISARGTLRARPEATLRLLVPVSDDAWSMRGLEFAVMLAKASGAKVAALYVRPRQVRRATSMIEQESPHRAVFQQARAIGAHYEVDIRTILDRSHNREISILSQARRGQYNLIVLGVSRRAGNKLSFGGIADTLLETSDRSLAFFTSS